MEPSKIVAKMHKLLKDPSRWTQGKLARDSTGKTVSCNASTAVCWCVTGALLKVVPDLEGLGNSGRIVGIALLIDAQTHGADNVPHANDAGTHAGMLAALVRVYRQLKKKGL